MKAKLNRRTSGTGRIYSSADQRTVSKRSAVSTVRRDCAGQGLIESACGLVIIVLVFVLLVAFGVNTYAAITYGTKLQIVAMETARVLDDERLWLGVKRPDYNAETSQNKAREVGKVVGSQIGLDGPNITFVFDEVAVGTGDFGGEVTVVTASLGTAPLPFNLGVYPTGIPVSSKAASARNTVQPYAVFDIDAPGVTADGTPVGTKSAVRIPCYGFFTSGNSSVAIPANTNTDGGAIFSYGLPHEDANKALNFRGLPLFTISNQGLNQFPNGIAGGGFFNVGTASGHTVSGPLPSPTAAR